MIIHPCTCGYAKPELVYYHGRVWVRVECPACKRTGESFRAKSAVYGDGEPKAVRAWNRKVHEPQRAEKK